MIELEFETAGYLQVQREDVSDTEIKLHFSGKDYKTKPDDYVIIKTIKYRNLILPELFEYTNMTTDNKDYAYMSDVDYVSFNGTWHLKFTENDVKEILKRKLT